MLLVLPYMCMVLLVLLLCSHREVWCCLCCHILYAWCCSCCSCVAIEKYGVARVAIYKYGVARIAIYYMHGVARVAPV